MFVGISEITTESLKEMKKTPVKRSQVRLRFLCRLHPTVTIPMFHTNRTCVVALSFDLDCIASPALPTFEAQTWLKAKRGSTSYVESLVSSCQSNRWSRKGFKPWDRTHFIPRRDIDQPTDHSCRGLTFAFVMFLLVNRIA